jgi:transposase-like protein
MTTFARKSDGRRIYTDQFKCEQIARVRRGELTVSELGRELGIARSLLQRWKRLLPPGTAFAAPGGRHDDPARGVPATRYIRELQQLLGKQSVELERLRAEVDALRGESRSRGIPRR